MPLTTDQLIAQSKAMLAQTAAEGTKAFAGSSYDTVKPTTPVAPTTPTITASALQPKTALNFQTPQTPLIPTVSAPTKTAEDIVNDMYGTPTKNEGQITELERSIAELTGKAAQEESRRAQLIGTPEFEAKRQQISSLVARANALSAEAQAIPLQMQQQIQEGGANVTKGGIAPIQTAALRNNAIQALSTGALLSAAQGDLTSALDQVDRAVAAEFEPIKAQLAAKRANLEMLMNDPASTREEKRRAAVAEVKLKQIETEQATKEENRKSIQALALQAQENGAPDVIVNNIMKSQDMESAIGSSQGWAAKQTAQSIQEYNFAVKNGYKGSFTQYQNEDANRKVAIAKAGVANGEFGLSQGQASLFNNIITKYNASPLIAAADRTIVLKNSIEQARKNPSDGATQLNLVYSYIQALDTYQSAVREGELGLVNSIDSKIGKLENYVSQVQNGQIIRPEVAKEIANAAENLVNTINQGAKSKAKSFESQAETLGLGDPWRKYQSGFQASFTDKTPQQKVEQAVQSSGKTYQQIISGAPKGQIAVVQDGVAGYIPVEEFDPTIQVKM